MKRLLFCLLLCVPVIGLAFTDVDMSKLLLCKEMPDDEKRLECFDKAAISLQVVAKERTAELKEEEQKPSLSGDTGGWEVEEETSKVDDSKSVFLLLASDEKVKGMFGLEKHPILILRCIENKTAVVLLLDTHLGMRDPGIIMRLDKEKPIKKPWNILTTYKGLLHPQPIKLIRDLLKSEKMFVRVVPSSGGAMDMEFSLAGLENVIKPLQKSCGWE